MTRDDPLAGEPFSYRQTRDGLVLISHSGRIVKTLRGAEARKFIAKAAVADARTAQLLMAKVTGQFKFGNERAASERRRRKGV
jgi:hypothetical protein